MAERVRAGGWDTGPSWGEVVERLKELADAGALEKVFSKEKAQDLGGKAVDVVEQETKGQDVVPEPSLESNQEVSDDTPEVDAPEEAEDIEDESESQLRKEVATWSENMAGTPEEYWKKLEERWWINEGVPMEVYGVPRIDRLMDGAKGILKKSLPELDEAGLQARAELATKVALDGLAEQEVGMLKQANVNFQGKRKLKKGWDAALLHQAYHAMKADLHDVYRDGELAKGDATEDELSESEEFAWWVLSAPKGEEREKRLAIKEEYDQKHKKAELAVIPQGGVQRLGADEAEVVKVPDPIVTRKMLEESEDELQKEPEVTALALVDKQEQKIEQKQMQEDVDVELKKTIDGTDETIKHLEEDVRFLEDYEPLKQQLLRVIGELKIKVAETQVVYGKAKDLIKEGKEQRAKGLSPDEVSVMDSDNLANGNLARETLCNDGILERGQTASEQLDILGQLLPQVIEKVQDAVVQQAEGEMLIQRIRDAQHYLQYQMEHEANEGEIDITNEVVTEFPDLRQWDKAKGQTS